MTQHVRPPCLDTVWSLAQRLYLIDIILYFLNKRILMIPNRIRATETDRDIHDTNSLLVIYQCPFCSRNIYSFKLTNVMKWKYFTTKQHSTEMILLMEELLHHLGCHKNSVNDGKKELYQPQLVIAGFLPSTVGTGCPLTVKNSCPAPIIPSSHPTTAW